MAARRREMSEHSGSAQGLVMEYVVDYNDVRLQGAIGHVALAVNSADRGRETEPPSTHRDL
jgi:hypothetical protein